VLAFHESATLCCGAGAPEPLRASTTGEFVALLAKETFAEALPDACGVNVTLKVAILPAASVKGKVNPLMANSEPAIPADETVTGAEVADSVAVWVCVVPTTTLPKLMLEGFTTSDPGVVPVPLSGMDSDGFEALELRVSVPLELPPVVGAKATLNV
jgi:hypothetical protein